LIGDSPPGADSPVGYAREVSAEISPLRYVLDADAIGRYRRLGADAVEAISETAVSLELRTSEREAAANLAAACWRRGMFSPVLLAASGERMDRYTGTRSHAEEPWDAGRYWSSAPSAVDSTPTSAR
jgi:hypothetical protein